jgi:hypothetical protein
MRATAIFIGALLTASSALAQQPGERWEKYVAAFEESDRTHHHLKAKSSSSAARRSNDGTPPTTFRI